MVLKIKTEEDRLNEDFLWLGRNMSSLQKDFEERWIAVVDKRVVGFGEDAKEAYGKAKQKFPNKEPLLNFIPKRKLLVL
jgi:hypothetical protein